MSNFQYKVKSAECPEPKTKIVWQDANLIKSSVAPKCNDTWVWLSSLTLNALFLCKPVSLGSFRYAYLSTLLLASDNLREEIEKIQRFSPVGIEKRENLVFPIEKNYYSSNFRIIKIHSSFSFLLKAVIVVSPIVSFFYSGCNYLFEWSLKYRIPASWKESWQFKVANNFWITASTKERWP